MSDPSPESKPKRGFAAMDPERQRAIASMGGRAVQELGTGHRFTSDEARIAGHRGGTAISQDREHMAEIGHRGGSARSRNTLPDAENG